MFRAFDFVACLRSCSLDKGITELVSSVVNYERIKIFFSFNKQG